MLAFCDSDETPADSSASVIRFPRGRLRWVADTQSRSRLRALLAASDGLHIHGIWEEHCVIAAALAFELTKPYVVSAHGMLEQWALRSKWLKKAVYS
ncbi:MAG: hypothetical protein ACRD7E_14255, partial [Bryobacteraceae bacterium]